MLGFRFTLYTQKDKKSEAFLFRFLLSLKACVGVTLGLKTEELVRGFING